jgi:hypothetical protein
MNRSSRRQILPMTAMTGGGAFAQPLPHYMHLDARWWHP